MEKSLLMTALLLYSRATHTSGKGQERGASTLERGQLTNDQWDDHNALIELRNRALSHVNPEHETDGRTWHKRLMFAIQLPGGHWKPASASNEVSFHRESLDRLCRMLPVAHSVILARFNERMTEIVDQINSAEVSEELLQSKAFDPVQAFGSLAAVKRLLTGSAQQTDSFWYNE